MLANIYHWLWWCKWRLLALMNRASPHPAIGKHWIITIDIDEIRKAIDERRPFALPLGTSVTELLLEPAPVSFDGAEVVTINDNDQQDTFTLDDVVTFKGRARGDETSWARFTVTDRVVLGYVYSRGEWWFIDPLKKFDRGAGQDQYVVYRTRDTRFRLQYGDDGKPAQMDWTENGNPPHRVNPDIGIAVWADPDYRIQAEFIGMNWWEAQASLINSVNGIYVRGINIEFRIRVFVLHVGSVLSSSDAETLLGQFGIRVRSFHGDIRRVDERRRAGVEVAHLTSGKDLDGNALGVAWTPGVWGLSSQKLFWIGGGGGFGGGPNLAFQNMMIAAHELGHNFNGKHDDANKICVTHFIWCWDFERTIMWPSFHGDNQERFSSRNSTRLRENAQRGRDGRFVHD